MVMTLLQSLSALGVLGELDRKLAQLAAKLLKNMAVVLLTDCSATVDTRPTMLCKEGERGNRSYRCNCMKSTWTSSCAEVEAVVLFVRCGGKSAAPPRTPHDAIGALARVRTLLDKLHSLVGHLPVTQPMADMDEVGTAAPTTTLMTLIG